MGLFDSNTTNSAYIKNNKSFDPKKLEKILKSEKNLKEWLNEANWTKDEDEDKNKFKINQK